jgi:hypothetical protein
MTVVATRLMRVTGDCFLALFAFVERFTAGFFRGATALEAPRVLRFAALFDLLFALPREAARFDAVDDLRAFRPDDFDAVAMIIFLVEGTRRQCARFAHTESGEVLRIAESPSHCGMQSPRDQQCLPFGFTSPRVWSLHYGRFAGSISAWRRASEGNRQFAESPSFGTSRRKL